MSEKIESIVDYAIANKSKNFKLAYALAFQLAGSGQGATAGPSLQVMGLFENALKRFNEIDPEGEASS